jgi:3-deoxy-D-manno-octulosonic-acid transferase
LGILLDSAYLTALALASPYLLYKAVTRSRHTRGLVSRLGCRLPKASSRPCIWVHGVSVGEILAAKTFITALQDAFPRLETVLSTSTSTGQEVARKTYKGHRLFYFPLDFSWSVSRIFDTIRPELIILVELELWPNFLAEARRRQIPVAVVNGRISDRSLKRYRLAPRLIQHMFGQVDRYCAQTETYAQRFRELGAEAGSVAVTGSMKYDSVAAPADVDPAAVRAQLGISERAPVLIGGSTHSGEELALLRAFAKLREPHPELRLILVPRHNERSSEVEREIQNHGLRCQRFSTLGERPRDDASTVLLVDVMGELGRLYAAADICFVGGSLIPHGGQNILEPASLGKAIVFGPHCFNFQESVEDLLAHDAAIEVKGPEALQAALAGLVEEPQRAKQLGAAALATIQKRRGATTRTIEALSQLLKTPTKH